jgi:hypothetical protein
MIEKLIGKVQRPFLAKFLLVSLLCASAETGVKNSDGRIGMIGTLMRSTVNEVVAVTWDALYDTTPQQ